MSDYLPDDWRPDDEDDPGGLNFEFDSDVSFDNSDIDPIFIGGVSLNDDDTVYAHVYVEPGAMVDPNDIDFSNLENLLGLGSEENDQFRGELRDLPDNFDFDADQVRGPFESEEELIDWLNETGLWGVADWYYDADTGEYWLTIISE